MDTQNTSPTRRTLLDDDWIVVIQAEIDAQPDTLADNVEPEVMGSFDAQMGRPCEPLAYYTKLGDIEAYIIGWKDTEATMRAARFGLMLSAMVGTEEMTQLLDTLDYENYMLDCEYHSRGGW